MKRSILGSRALRVACACALALGIAPAAAWGAADGEQPASDVEALQEVVEDISEDKEMPSESDGLMPDGDTDSEPANEHANESAGVADGEDESGEEDVPDTEKPASDNAPASASESEAQPGSDVTPTVQPLGESGVDASISADGIATTTQASTTYTLTLDSDSVDIELYRCPVCSGGVDGDIYHCSGLEEVGYRITSSDGSSLPDYWFECDASDASDRIGYFCESDNSSGVLNPIAATPGQASVTLTVVDAETSEPLATATLTINGIVSTEEPSFTPISNVTPWLVASFPWTFPRCLRATWSHGSFLVSIAEPIVHS